MKHTLLLLALFASVTLHAMTSVGVENQHIVLTQNGVTTVLTPNGADESYYWVSLSPDGQQILYSTAHHGTCICDLQGNVVSRLGRLNAPKWMDNGRVSGMREHYINHDEIDHTDYYCVTLADMHIRSLTPAEQQHFILQEKARLAEAEQRQAARIAARRLTATTGLAGLKIYVNPGHGGHDANDRSCWTIPIPETWTNPLGYWESNSNLVKGLYLRDMLQAAGATVIMSRTTNNSGSRDVSYYPNADAAQLAELMAGDDRDLSAIAEEANANQVDHFISIHSNALNTQTNYLLMLYHGLTGQPTVPTSDLMAASSGAIQLQNPLTVWTAGNVLLRGDISFYGDDPSDPYAGLGVLRPLTVPGFLSEGSFHDYPPETHRLCNNDYCKLEALRMYQHFHRYYNRLLPQTACISGWVKSSNEKVDVLGQPKFVYVQGSDDQWLPLNGAKVVLISEQGVRLDSVITDNWYNGVYAFYDLAPGTYTVEASLENYKTMTQTVTVVAEQIAGVKMFLRNNHLMVPDYEDPEQDAGTMPLTDYVFKSDNVQASGASAYTRVVYKGGHIVTLDASGTIVMRNWDFSIYKTLATPAGLQPSQIKDIAFTSDGMLVATIEGQHSWSVYIWDDEYKNASLLFTESSRHNTIGHTITVSGPRWQSTYYTEVGGELNSLNYNEDTPTVHPLQSVGTVAANSQLMIAPGQEVYADASGMMAAFFRYANTSYMAKPESDGQGNIGFRIYDISAGIANAVSASQLIGAEPATSASAIAYVDGYTIHVGLLTQSAAGYSFKGYTTITTPVADIYAGEVSFDGNTFRFRLNDNATDVVIAIEKEGETKDTYDCGAMTKGVHEVANPFGTQGFDAYSITASARSVGYPVKISTDETKFQFYAPRGVAVDKCPTSPYFGRVYVSESLGGQITEGAPEVARHTSTGIYSLSADFTDITNQGDSAWSGNIEWGANNSGTHYQWSLARFAVAPSGKVFVTSTAFSSANVYIMDPAHPDTTWTTVFGGKRNTNTGALKFSGATVCNPIMSCCVLGEGTEEVLYTMDRDNSLGTVGTNIKAYNIGQVDSLPWKQAPSSVVYDDMLDLKFQNGSGELAYDQHGGWFMSQYRYNSSEAIPSLIHITNGVRDYNCGSSIATSQQGGMGLSADGSMLAIGRELGAVAVYDVVYDAAGTPTLTEKYVIDWGAGKGNTMSCDFDAAGNLYIVSNSNERLMVYALPKANNSYTTRIPYNQAGTDLKETEALNDGVQKIIVDGQVYIIKNGRTYTVLGQMIK